MNEHTEGVVIVIVVAILAILFAGEPDIMDAIISHLMK